MMSLSIGFFVCLRDNRRKLLDRSKFVDECNKILYKHQGTEIDYYLLLRETIASQL